MGQMRECKGVATSIRQEGPDTVVRYHETDVVRFNAESIRLLSGGYQTATTKAWMNQASAQFGLGYHVRAKAFTWYVTDDAGNDLRFYDGMILSRYVRGL